MRRAATIIFPISLALLLLAPFVRGPVFIGVLGVLTVTILARTARRIRRSGASPVPWLVSLGVSAITTTPQVAFGHYRHAAAGVFAGVFWWLVLAVFLRFVIFLADYFRRRQPERTAPANTRSPTATDG